MFTRIGVCLETLWFAKNIKCEPTIMMVPSGKELWAEETRTEDDLQQAFPASTSSRGM